MYRLISVVILLERGTGRNKHGVVIEWILSACVWCLVSACSLSWLSTLFICAVFLWAPEHLCDIGLDIGDELNERLINNNRKTTNEL